MQEKPQTIEQLETEAAKKLLSEGAQDPQKNASLFHAYAALMTGAQARAASSLKTQGS